MNKEEKQEIIEMILLAIVELKDASEDGASEERQEMIWRDIEDHLTILAYGRGKA